MRNYSLMTKLILFSSINLLFILFNTAHATTTSENQNFLIVQKQLAKAENIHGEFTQKRIIKVLSQPLLSSGTFSLSKAKGLEWIQKKPFPSTLHLSSSKLTQTIDNNPPMVLTKEKQPLVFSFSKIFLSAFRGEQSTLEKSFNISFKGTPTQWEMLLTPKSTLFKDAINSIQLQGGETIQKVIVNSAKGDKLMITFYNVKVGT